MFKKLTAMFLVIILALSVLSGCGSKANTPEKPADSSAAQTDDEKNPYSKKLSFTVYSLDDADDFMDYPLVKEAKEKFNFDFEIQQVAWDSWDETTRTLVATDSLPEVLAWYNLIYPEYLNWVNEGAFKAFPEDLSPYPELKKLTEQFDVFDKIKVDGKLYAFPKVISSNPYNEYSTDFIAYRKDWADAMSKNFSSVQELTWDEFVDYLKELKQKDPGKLGDKLVPFDLIHGGQTWVELAGRWNPYMSTYHEVDGKYVWGARDASAITALKEIKKLYDEGLLATDSYADKAEMGKERFYAGRSATYYSNFSVPEMMETSSKIQQSTPGFKQTDMGILAVKNDAGKYHVNQKSEWWGAFAFRHDCPDEIVDRWLAVGNWLLEPEQVEKYAYGTLGEDWEKDADGKVTVNWKQEDIATGASKAYISDERNFQKFFILEGMEVWLEGNPNIPSYIVNDLFKTALKTYETNPDFIPTDYNLAFFSAPNYNQPINVSDAVIKAVVSDNPEKVWNEFLETNKTKVDAVLKELNDAFSK